MGVEIERKFLVSGEAWRSEGEGVLFRQGYLSTVAERSVRNGLQSIATRLLRLATSRSYWPASPQLGSRSIG